MKFFIRMSQEVVVDAVHPQVEGETVHPVIDDLLCLVVDSGLGLDRRLVGIEEVPLPFLAVVEVLRSGAPGRGHIHLRLESSIREVQLQQKMR